MHANTLKDTTSEEDDAQSAVSSKRSINHFRGARDGVGEDQVSAEVGSTGSLDQIKEDFNRTEDARATGFMGKISEVTWMHRLRTKAEDGSSPDSGEDDKSNQTAFPNGIDLPPSSTHHGLPSGSRSAQNSQPLEGDGLVDSTYHCDDIAMLQPDQVDPYELPPRHVAEFLLQTYLETVHPSFPIIGKLNFAKQMKSFFDNDQSRPGTSWLAILNFIFAIAAKYSHLVQAELRGDDRDHLIYFTRGRVLGMEGDGILAQPDLQRVQVTGLMAFYLMSVNQINRHASFSKITRYMWLTKSDPGRCAVWPCAIVSRLDCIFEMKIQDYPNRTRKSGIESGGPYTASSVFSVS